MSQEMSARDIGNASKLLGQIEKILSSQYHYQNVLKQCNYGGIETIAKNIAKEIAFIIVASIVLGTVAQRNSVIVTLGDYLIIILGLALAIGLSVRFFKTSEETRGDAEIHLEQLDTQLQTVGEQWRASYSWYPEDYMTSEAAGFFYSVLSNGRADTFKEATNLYEEECHRRRIENSQQEMVRNQQEMVRNQQVMNQQQAEGNMLQHVNNVANIFNAAKLDSIDKKLN